MYLSYFGLQDNPFSIAPNPAYLYMSPRHKEALAHLTYGLRESGGFVMLTGEVDGQNHRIAKVRDHLKHTSRVNFESDAIGNGITRHSM